ncbi:MAG: hypothetical protein LBQ31_10225 [Bacteroidales bacterium]|jgi:hypothetical protein|nr:hypothetical protein [Bacteroidales bacterium]
MIRTVVVPSNNAINLSIPLDYIGKKIEILLYKSDEVKEKPLELHHCDVANFKGILTSDEADKYNQYLQNARLCIN